MPSFSPSTVSAPPPALLSQEPLPLTEAQKGLWYAQRLDPDNPLFNTSQTIDIVGPLDIPALSRAVALALAEAPGLNARFGEGPDGPWQKIAPPGPGLEVVDLRGHGQAAAATAQALLRRDEDTPLDLGRDSPTREILFRTGADRYLWYQRIHHLAIDGYGVALLTHRIGALYTAAVLGRAAGPRLDDYALVLAEDAAYQGSAQRDDDRRFWQDLYRQPPAVESPAAGPAVSGHRFQRHRAALPEPVGAALRRLAERTGLSWPDILTGLLAAYLRRHQPGGEDGDPVVGIPHMNRLGSAAARVPAMVMNVLPLRLPMDEDAPLAETLASVAGHLRQARRHGRYRGEQLRRDLGLLGGNSRLHGPLINILPFDTPPALPGAETHRHVRNTGPVDDLTLTVRADAAARDLCLEIDSNPALHTDAETAAHLDRLTGFLSRALTASRLADVPTLLPREHHRWTETVNRTAHPVRDGSLTEWLVQSMARHPEAPAVRFGDRALRYDALDRLTARLAARLAAAEGVGRGDIVGVAMPRSLDLVVALIAILRAGAAYLPIDPDHPAERIAATLSSARPRLVLTAGLATSALPGPVPVLRLDIDTLSRSDDTVRGEDLPPPPRLDDPAYVIYTSGSTGIPKGVVVSHGAIVNRLDWMATHYGIGPDERILQKTPSTFDVSVWEFFLPLVTGATLVVAPPDAHKDPAWLARLLREERITTVHFVPSMLTQFLAEPTAAGLVLRRVFCSGEELPAAVRDRFHRVMTAELHNLYGPTEAAVDVTYWPASADDASSPVPIGFPVWNTALYVLDRHLRPVPPGIAGDLYIGGRQLAQGYLHRPDLTQDRFIPDPFQPGGRLYKTGDIARWRPDGALVFLGRSDHQVKIRGLRIELGEIEAVLRQAPEVDQAVAILRGDRDKQLWAYLVPRDPATGLDLTRLAAFLATRLPDYMIPRMTTLTALPVTANGKLDRSALPVPDCSQPRQKRAPASPTEQKIATILAEVLDLTGPEPRLGADDDFFANGGHSLLAAQAVRRIRDAFALPVGLGALFLHPTPARLAAYLDAQTDSGDWLAPGHEGLGVILPLVRPRQATLPPLFCIHPAGGLSWCYARLARAMDPRRPVYGLQARGLDPDQPLPSSLTALATDYVDQIRRIDPDGPHHLLGWSVGGIIAHQMAVQLSQEGQTVGMLAMLDAYPCDCWRDEPDPDESAALGALLRIAGIDPPLDTDRALDRAMVSALLRQAGHPLATLPDDSLEGVLRVVENNNRLVRRHVHQLFDGTVLHFRAALDHAGTALSPQSWAPYAQAVRVWDIPAWHGQLIGAAATRLIAPVLQDRLTAGDRLRSLQPQRPQVPPPAWTDGEPMGGRTR